MSRFTEKKYVLTFVFVTSLFMLWGIAITMGETLNRHFQKVLHISISESFYVQFSVFGAYAIMAIPAGLFMKRFGYQKGVIFGLALYAIGAFLFAPAADAQSFLFFRVALFVLACGLATLETVAHPFVASLGDQSTSDQRINFSQSFNGLGAVIGPLMGGYFLLRAGHDTGDPLNSVKTLYIAIGAVITAIAISFAFVKVPALVDPHVTEEIGGDTQPGKKLFQNRHFVWAVIAQFFNVAAQAGTWGLFINAAIINTPGLSDEGGAYYFSLSMLCMMAGRFLGTALMRFVIAPNKLLAIFAVANAVLCIVVAQKLGTPSLIALILMNFFMGIMFPTIFSLGLKNLGSNTQQGSSFIVMGVVGGAVFPPIMGIVVAHHGISDAYYLPIICYAVIFLFGWKFYKVKTNAKA